MSRPFSFRSQLFVPASRSDFVAKATLYDADAIILDLEDSVPSTEKPAARKVANDALRAHTGPPIFVRVNHSLDELDDDLRAVVAARPDGLVLPKVESAEDVLVVDRLVAEQERRADIPVGSIAFQILVETCVGLLAIPQILGSSPRIVSGMLGLEDLSAELEVEPGSPGFDVSWAHGLLLAGARAAKVQPYGLMDSLTNYTELELFSANVRRSRAFGYVGTCCIHPDQVAIANAGFSPTPEEVQHARGVLRALESAERKGRAATTFEGRMIDPPVADRARSVLERAGRAHAG